MAPAASITTRLRVEGMDCASCATKIRNALQRMPGISEVNVSVTGGTVTVRRDPNGVDDDTIRDQISDLGYGVARSETYRNDVQGKGEESSPAQHDAHSHLEEASGQHWWQTRKGQLTIASGGALAVAFAVGKAVPATEHLAFLMAMMVGLIPIAKRAISAAMAGTPFSIEMLMSIAAVGAVFIGATEEAATVVFLFLIGELLEGVAASRARASIQDLTKLVPKTARLEEDGHVREVQADALSVGATIQVRPGDRIPADGVIMSGESSIDEAPVTGESTPVRKGRDEN
ncbi:MAG: heavy metal translocating P-type ATPase, partial [Bradyrhizobium sp.]|nr:heavy metal translocating P-type ATPase [Bradyrhizobium sp.]